MTIGHVFNERGGIYRQRGGERDLNKYKYSFNYRRAESVSKMEWVISVLEAYFTLLIIVVLIPNF